MTSEQFTSIKFEGDDGMHPRMFCDYFAGDLPPSAKLDEPGPYDKPYSRIMEITNISIVEAEKISALIREKGGRILEN